MEYMLLIYRDEANAPEYGSAAWEAMMAGFLAFNQRLIDGGHFIAGGGLRTSDLDESIRLAELLLGLVPDEPEVRGLLAQQLFHRARTGSRFDTAGDLIRLDDQDRSAWDLPTITRGNRVPATAVARMRPGVFQLQALIASHHANARTAGDTDWPAIAAPYGQLFAMTGSPIVALNHAVAVGMADGPGAGLALLDRIDGLSGYHLEPAARAELLARAGRPDEAAEAFDEALRLVPGGVERRHLQRRRAACRGDPAPG